MDKRGEAGGGRPSSCLDHNRSDVMHGGRAFPTHYVCSRVGLVCSVLPSEASPLNACNVE